MSRRQPRREPAYRPLRFKQEKAKCPTGKLRYPSAVDAGIALARARATRTVKGRDQVVEVRHYPCPTCKGYHLTSKPKAA